MWQHSELILKHHPASVWTSKTKQRNACQDIRLSGPNWKSVPTQFETSCLSATGHKYKEQNLTQSLPSLDILSTDVSTITFWTWTQSYSLQKFANFADHCVPKVCQNNKGRNV